ncbi:rod shape-determining protein MreC [bacterium]|nr:rod shape-determining protein MreC [bacterium]
MIFKLNPYQKAYFTNSSAAVTANINNFSTSVSNYFGLREQNIMLQESIIDSSIYHNPYLSLHYFSDTLEVKDTNAKPLFSMVPAQVVFNSVHKADNVFVINKGSNDGIKKGAGVISSKGVAGIITSVGPNFSTAMSVLHTEFNLIPQINGQEFFTDIIWDNENPHTLTINKINKLEPIDTGDLVSTGMSSLIFPAGIPLGYIEKLIPVKGSQYLDTKITTATNFRKLNYVFVVQNNYIQEIEDQLDETNN